MRNNYVYILGSNDRTCYEIVRAIYKKYKIILITDEKNSPVIKSKLIDKKILIKKTSNIHILKYDIFKKLDKKLLIIPVNDYYLNLILYFYEEFAEKYILPYSNKTSVINLINKEKILVKSKTFNDNSLDYIKINNYYQFEKINFDKYQFPLIVKPTLSCRVINDRIISSKVHKVDNYDELRKIVRFNISNFELMIQEFIPGKGIAINFFAVCGSIKNIFQYERLHEPGWGGGSSFRKSSDLDQDIRQFSENLIKDSMYSGVGMIEFRKCSFTGKNYLMEVNARFWGSLSLPTFSGINFPDILCDYFLNQKLQCVYYKKNFYSRNIFKDIKWNFNNFKKFKLTKIYGENFLFIKNIINKNEKYDLLNTKDVLPFIYSIYNINILVLKKLGLKIEEFALFIYINFERRHLKNRIRKLIFSENVNVYFVCKGNIIRSPFASKYYNQKFKQSSKSFGLVEHCNRKSPLTVVNCASNFSVSLEQELSKSIYDLQNTFKKSDIFFVMNNNQYRIMKRKYSLNNVFILGIFSNKFNYSIADPYCNLKDYNLNHRVFSKIIQSIDNFDP